MNNEKFNSGQLFHWRYRYVVNTYFGVVIYSNNNIGDSKNKNDINSTKIYFEILLLHCIFVLQIS